MNEERFSPWEESKDSEQKSVRDRAKSIIDFLRSSNEEDEDTTEKGGRRKKGKSSRWRKFLRNMFGAENAQEEEDEAKKTKRPLILFEPIKRENDTESAVEAPVGSSKPEKNEESSPTSQKELELQEPPKNKDKTSETDKNNSSKQVEAAEKPEREAHTADDEPLGLLKIDHSDDRAVAQPTREEYVRGPEPRSEVQPEAPKSSGVGALLAIDYLNYRSRKKLEKRLEKRHDKQEKQLKGVSERVEQQAKELERQKNTVQAQREQAPAIAHTEKPHVEPLEVKSETKKVVNQKRREAPRSSTQEKQYINTENRPSKYVTRESTAEPTGNNEKQFATQQELERAEAKQAASIQELERKLQTNQAKRETDNYSEKGHERKNEVRDTPIKSAPSVGSILQNNYSYATQQPQSSNEYQHSFPQKSITNTRVVMTDGAYGHQAGDGDYLKRAATRGAYGGLVIIVIAVLIRLIS